MNDELNNLIWMNTADAAKYLRISKSRLHNLTSLGHVKYYKFLRSNRYYKKDLDEMIFKNRKFEGLQELFIADES